MNLKRGDRAKVIGGERFPIGTIVVVLKCEEPAFGTGARQVHVVREGMGNIVESALNEDLLEKVAGH